MLLNRPPEFHFESEVTYNFPLAPNAVHSTVLKSLPQIDACDLPPMDANGKSDPYVVVSIRPPSKGGEPKQHKTAVHRNTLNPTFNETAKLRLLPDEIMGKTILHNCL